MDYNLNDPNLDFDIEQEALINALKGARADRRTMAPDLTGQTWAPSGSGLGGVGAALMRAAGGIDEARAMRENRALSAEQQRRMDTLQQELMTPGTKEVEGYSYGQGPLMDLSEQPKEQAPLSPLEQSKRRLDVYSRMSRLPMARGLATAGIKSEVDFPERQALLEQQQAAARATEAARAQERAEAAADRRLYQQGMLGVAQQNAETSRGRADDARATAQQKLDEKAREVAIADDAFRAFGEAQIRDIDFLIGARDPVTGKLAVDPTTGKPLQEPHKGFGQAVGLGVPGLRHVPGTDTASYAKTHEGVMSSARLEGVKMMKGAGAVSNAEGEAAARALNKADLAQKEDDYVRAMLEYRNIMQKGIERRQRGVRVDPISGAEIRDPSRAGSGASGASGAGVSEGAKVVSRVKLKDGSTGVLWSDGSRTRE